MSNLKLTLGALATMLLSVLAAHLFAPVPAPVSTPPFGAVASPDILSPYFSVGGVRSWATRQDTLFSASTTVCTLQSPNATTTLELGSGIRLASGTTTAATISVYKSSAKEGNTTFLFGENLAANGAKAIVASTTNDNFLLGPNTWINFLETGGTGTYSNTGVCVARFKEI